ncbi:putative 5-formyltetrahydrofolate cyclo-ligase [Fragariocoptes setiger]|uniref:5-formyltetrahydrofolate cyclo-ligase n=1 Tax=Fragariocoptes setiger TaxID=1670756 RepID=A0ABQ7S844_9ACAR|nr:putative 5-formyltetrahydrofolate cyclo-ligase [Fragariocoptes setiger]
MRESKRLLRTQMRKILSQLTDDEIKQQSAQIYNQVVHHPRFIDANYISIYLSTNREVDTVRILEKALELNKVCFVPKYARISSQGDEKPRSEMKMYNIISMKDFDNMPLTKWNIKEPSDDSLSHRNEPDPQQGLDLVIVPGVAFTKTGLRLGHGMGYYDRFLNDWACQHPTRRPFTMGLALKQQVLHQVPCSDTDYILDQIVTCDES